MRICCGAEIKQRERKKFTMGILIYIYCAIVKARTKNRA
jgi:hypothetical protein